MSHQHQQDRIRTTSFADSANRHQVGQGGPVKVRVTRDKEGRRLATVIATLGPNSAADKQQEITYTGLKLIGNGSFGVVYQARLVNSNEQVAIKKVRQDKRFKNRELQIMRRLDHCNILRLQYFFYSIGETEKEEPYLNLVLDYMPETVYVAIRHHSKNKQIIPSLYSKLYMYQLLRSLAYIHANGVCHRDIKPQNLLLNPETGVLKLCDFGSAKVLVRGEPNVSYICSRYYRAPELIFGATDYCVEIDVWSSGCVFAELLLGQPIFPGDSGVDQLVEIIKVLGTPTKEQIRQMNSNYTEFKFPQIKPHPWNKVFRPRTAPEAIDLVSRLLEYTPSMRIHPMEACAHPFFDELRQNGAKMPNGREFPPLFNFTQQEMAIKPSLQSKLVPPHLLSTEAGSSGPASSSAAAAASSSATAGRDTSTTISLAPS